jgi:hypothetical protein
MEENMYKCKTCGRIICDSCHFSTGECSECFNTRWNNLDKGSLET